ncbi:hemolysin secretion protein D [Rhizobium wenxiniae]|uniref:Macrolide-specific efflux system membrane fusion protein n=1 Tax=Rhizobium wenxiniae TaxID=1737357 RepID=A0A7X0D2Y9_9HYPH|nr:efflux RND transporter periplasmic adaptor subunit [Rhizobium wenxiniae]MBB6164996.1 macrolide-specific efflux system membrane fusion protein [Rhizobium wenxiniae]GGG10480.1 hemolysin secretion protein D [Rhizobium wenxiniae]
MRLKTALPLLLIALVIIGVGTAFTLSSSASTAAVLTTPVARGNVESTVLATGTLKPSRLVAVGSQASGRITSLKVAVGDTVKAGDLIALIDSTTQDNALKTARAALANVQAQRNERVAELENANLTLARQQAIYEKQAGSRADLQTAEAEVKVVTAQIEALDAQITEAEVAVETAQADVGYTRISAPMDGTVLAIVNQEGRTVNATQSAPTIVALGDLTRMTVRAEISEADITRVEAGQKVRFNVIGDRARSYDATLAAIEPAPETIVDDSSVATSSTGSSSSSSSSSSSAIYYIGVFDIPNDDGRFRTYMSAEVNIILGSAADVLTIPSSALPETAATGEAQVRVEKDGRIETRQVEIGLNNKITAEVRSGLSEGERVVIGEGSAAPSTSSSRGGPPPMF